MKRIQRKRTKGWRMPPNTKYVGRGSKFGNPFRVVKMYSLIGSTWTVIDTRKAPTPGIHSINGYPTKNDASRMAVDLYRVWSEHQDFSELAGHDLACWCKEDEPCHADVILERLANEN